jgi:tetratricopeptide (TPR) repeat protein
VAFSPDGQRLASGSDDKTVKVWDVATGQELHTLKGHTGEVNSVAFSPDGQRLASASLDRMVKVWDVVTGQGVLTLPGHADSVNSVVFSPDGQRLASGGKDGTVIIWESKRDRKEVERRWPIWHLNRAVAAEKAGDWFAAAFHLNWLSEQAPEDITLRGRRGWAYAEQAKWDRAIADYSQVAQLKPELTFGWHNKAMAHLAKQELSAYRQICAQMLARFGSTKDAGTADTVAYLSVLKPDAETDTEALIQLAEMAVVREPDSAVYLETLGAALYRANRYEDAVKRLNEAVKKQGAGGSAWMQQFLAMAHHRLGHADEARQWLAKADERIRKRLRREANDATAEPPSWRSRLRWQLLQREAEALINSKPEAPKH